MDINLIRSLLTVAAMAAFFGIVWWAYAPSRKAAWEQRGVLDAHDNLKDPA
jgi:cbb3-type cytochrome oxidase subunit 3